MSIVPMNQGTDLFTPQKFMNDKTKAKQSASKAINEGIAGGLSLVGVTLLGENPNDITDDPARAIVNLLYQMKLVGGSGKVGTQVYSDDQSGNPNGVAIPKGDNSIDTKGV